MTPWQKVRLVSQPTSESRRLAEQNDALSNEVGQLQKQVAELDLELDELMARSLFLVMSGLLTFIYRTASRMRCFKRTKRFGSFMPVGRR